MTANLLKLVSKAKISNILLTTVFLGAGLFPNAALAQSPEANLTVVYLGTNNNDPNDGWIKNVEGKSGDTLQFYIEIHNTIRSSQAKNLTVKSALPQGSFTEGESRVDVTAANAIGVAETVKTRVTGSGGGSIEYVPGSTKMTWDQDGDGTYEFSETVMPDQLVGEGLVLGDLEGCNEFIIQISFRAKIAGAQQTATPSPTPTPTPAPSPTPTPTGATGQSQNQSQTQNVTQTVNVSAGQVAGTQSATLSASAKELPKTGPSLFFFSSLLGGLPGGVLLKGLAGRFREKARGTHGSPKEGWLWLRVSQEKRRKKEGTFLEES